VTTLDERPLPREIGRPATAALGTIGVTRLAHLTAFPANELLALHGFGPKALRILREKLGEQGLALAGEAPSVDDA
jgi:predicted flap endonuclease-1-like 5' DNA nuclease